VVKERRPRQEATIAVCEWTTGGESSSSSSRDESRKNFTTRFMQGPSSSLHMCLMAQSMESNVSDDESDTTSLDDLVELVHEQKGMLKKQANEIKELNTLNDLSATLATNYENLLCKFKFLARSVMSSNLSLRAMRLKQVIPLSLMNHLSLVQFLSPR
jgi:hypothetical protein